MIGPTAQMEENCRGPVETWDNFGFVGQCLDMSKRSWDHFSVSSLLRRHHLRFEASVLGEDHQYFDLIYFTYRICRIYTRVEIRKKWRVTATVSMITSWYPSCYWIFVPFWDLRLFKAQSWIARKTIISPPAQEAPVTPRSPESKPAHVLSISMLSIIVPAIKPVSMHRECLPSTRDQQRRRHGNWTVERGKWTASILAGPKSIPGPPRPYQQ